MAEQNRYNDTNRNIQYNKTQQKKNTNDSGYWITAFVFLVIGAWPVSLIMLIVKLVSDNRLDRILDRIGDLADGRTSARKVQARPRQTPGGTASQTQPGTTYQSQNTAGSAAAGQSAAQQPEKPAADAARHSRRAKDTVLRQPKKGAKLLMVAGALIAAVGAVVVFGSVAEIISWGYYNYLLDQIFTGLGFLLCGGLMHGAGRRMQKKDRRYNNYLRVIKDQRIVMFKTLASVAGVSTRRVIRDLEEMLEDGDLPQGAFIDRTRECLVLDSAAMPYQMETDATLRMQQAEQSVQEQAAQPRPTHPKAADEFGQILQNIRTANEDIEDAVMSAKIDHIETITRSIFAIVEEKPERRQEIRSFFNYYLPTTQKLLDFYAQLEEQPVQSQTIVDSRRNIEGIMDNLVKGFENQLDSLFRADALDISADISVLENMLAQDGLGSLPGEDAIAAAARSTAPRRASTPSAQPRSGSAAATAAMPLEK